MGEAHELQRGLGGSTSLVEGTTRLLPGQSKARSVQGVHERPWHGGLDGSHLELRE